ncbi:uncharacterized protein LOC110853196 [Folsomia candida]|uniref:Chitin-binding type-4 domain-containing protein n=1 Tax=Folsomia candida TaxID=158441 RepID=A0A226F392_FOLCA|nr:uncharacterized protein LOC110853196 [Folsomia candida]XP_021957146.1 uncharacterized protein LOC110853196 [Folsomia candida]XP_021957154.1 uncharacterized protein LOC110853196 [Folsomia candida]XP_035710246.1 uncharacterized protein LOC110853196 [Folsomia candida]OXA63894.1 hypothetical protein Fcan01_03989 [Folsomia candida]
MEPKIVMGTSHPRKSDLVHHLIFTFWGSVSLFTFLFLASCPHSVSSHGRLIEPPSRSSMWRYGFNTTANYNDHELYCGGFARQHQKNRGKCGVCGDPFDGPKPNEAGGPYAQGIIVRKYRTNSIIRLKVELTANHKGYFEFRLCPNNNPKKVVSQKCLDNYLLQQSNSEGPRYYPSEGTKVFESRFLLPKGLTCTQCVLQWRYVAANSWGGPCADGSPEGIGCGPQEEFRACSDVAVYDDKGYASAEEPEFTEDKLESQPPTPKSNTTQHPAEYPTDQDTQSSGQVWPFILAFILILFFTAVASFVLWWFYRGEIILFLRETRRKFNPKWGRDSQNISNYGGDPHMTYPTSTFNSSSTTSGPVPPPRNKKHNSSTHHDMTPHRHHHHPDIYGGQRQHKIITPDLISQPLQVTINGLPA